MASNVGAAVRTMTSFTRVLDSPSAPRLLLVGYFAAVATIGLILVFRATPMSGMDETYHFRRALQISEGHPIALHLGPNNRAASSIGG